MVNFSTMYMGYLETNAQHPGHVERKELDATEQIIRKNMTALESACRKRLSELAK